MVLQQSLTNTVGLGLFGDSSSAVLLIRLDCCFFPNPEVLIPVLSVSNRFRASACLDRMLIRTCFIMANSWKTAQFIKEKRGNKSKTINEGVYDLTKKCNSSLLSLLMFSETFAFKNSGRRNQTQSNDGTTCTKGLQGWQQRQQQQGREGDSRPFHGSIYHL